jgi:hypothetical protein
MKKKRFSTEQIVSILKQANEDDCVRPDPTDLDIGADLLPLEEAVWRALV